MEGNDSATDLFSEGLVRDVKMFESLNGRSQNREMMWKALFSLCSSHEFVTGWCSFLKHAGAIPTPTLYQFLTDLVLRHILRRYEVTDMQQQVPCHIYQKINGSFLDRHQGTLLSGAETLNKK